jgi:hypothetical protein
MIFLAAIQIDNFPRLWGEFAYFALWLWRPATIRIV